MFLLKERKGFLENLNHFLAVLGSKGLEIPVKFVRNLEIERREHRRFGTGEKTRGFGRGWRYSRSWSFLRHHWQAL